MRPQRLQGVELQEVSQAELMALGLPPPLLVPCTQPTSLAEKTLRLAESRELPDLSSGHGVLIPNPRRLLPALPLLRVIH